ncbi:hypothetical protein H112_05990 [Trichophyton rubrum D6]|uniref:Immediate-early protein n=4 Tax=Trichophyton TaxID=5550 RepID=A0A178ESV9_TRIRU|nr:uncharacterized protein TERG_03697 [Trichophyton rubrum CBS 118892]EZF14819.1 hypothetical protein H100_06004 [Trichophyton rubrum MR850]EZF39936.1 hypothetical protein H102_05973 [Trichophyton rubrum CBS 100081]EZF50576.1 hypothetical protein H103_05998 [Trichophyton rubrum CBS 288.86]EZF61120.1 hypothetical protein H104_05986 [Trichophyton rubrum CBS 289.86]EZF71753.1 hypothetical protein H105_06013 [Trichophyton soudanense CBS 452.61]EZF82336.1 hypothetical protein H110_05994 [Trichophy
MLSQIVTAARGLFKRPESTEDTASEQEQPADMVTIIENSTSSQEMPATQESPVASGKRKDTSSSVPESVENRPQKRRKGEPSSKAADPNGTIKSEGDAAKQRKLQVLESVTIINQPNTNFASTIPADGKHVLPNPRKIRFGSEELNGTHLDVDEKHDNAELENGTAAQAEDDEDDSSDDDAPEAVSNAVQLSQIREAERKREETRQMHEQLRREKRKEHEKRLQQQAASKAAIQKAADARREAKAKRAEAKTSKHDEQQSESSMTLSAGTRESKHGPSAPLPALLPDEILNAELSQPLITGLDVEKLKMNTPRHIRITDTADRQPKDLKIGSTAIRVLGDSGSGSNPILPPKSSNSSRRVKENWVGGRRKMGATGALRHSTGGPKSFARK